VVVPRTLLEIRRASASIFAGLTVWALTGRRPTIEDVEGLASYGFRAARRLRSILFLGTQVLEDGFERVDDFVA
jgi:hypothetical protein